MQTKELQFIHFGELFKNNERINIMNKMEEKEIIDIAVEQLNRQTAQITIKIECKKWINKTNLPRLLTDINAHTADVQTMLVTEYINPNIAE